MLLTWPLLVALKVFHRGPVYHDHQCARVPHHNGTYCNIELAAHVNYCNRRAGHPGNHSMLKVLAVGVVGSGFLVRMADGRRAVLKAFKPRHGESGDVKFKLEVALQQAAADAGLGPRVLGLCPGPSIKKRAVFSEALGGAWLDESQQAAYCPEGSLSHSAPRALAPYCAELGALLARMDSSGVLQSDMYERHLMRNGHGTGELRVIDFSAASLYNSSLPAGANWCAFASLVVHTVDVERRTISRSIPDSPCLQRCLLHADADGNLPPDDGPVGDLDAMRCRATSLFEDAQVATNRKCSRIVAQVAKMPIVAQARWTERWADMAERFANGHKAIECAPS